MISGKIVKEKRILLLTVSVILAAALTLTLVLCASARKDKDVDDNELESSARVSQRRNFLLLGVDRVSGLTDVMMLISLDSDSGRLDILQIPRDTYAEYADLGYRKINGASKALGADGVCDFLSRALCVDIEGYASIGLDSFAGVVDMIGGVEIDIPFDMEYRDPYQDLYISIPAGRQTLNGARAEQFVRYRFGYVRGDLGRIDAQKLFMSAFLRQVREEVGRLELLRIAGALFDEIDTNISLTDALSLATSVLGIDAERINMLTLSGEDVRSENSGAWFYVISKSAAQEQMSRYMGADTDESKFDRDGAFLYESSERFAKIYASYLPYSVTNAGELDKNGIEIEKS